MKIHKYEVQVYESVLDYAHACGQTQTRLFIPGQAVLGYRGEKQIDFFSDKPEIIAEAENCNKIESDSERSVRYLGELDLPDKEVLEVISAGKEANQAKKNFHQKVNLLIEIIERR